MPSRPSTTGDERSSSCCFLKPRAEPRDSFKDGLFHFLRGSWAGLYGSTCDEVLFNLTSTSFEVDGTKALESTLQRHGYSRDTRSDCLRVVIALLLTPGRFPLAYEVMPGNISDKGMQLVFIGKLETKSGKLGNLRLMDCGVQNGRCRPAHDQRTHRHPFLPHRP